MCGIALVPKKNLCDTLENQKVRWLDSLWIIDFQSHSLLTTYKESLAWYQYYIESEIEPNEELCFMHHRKASIGAVKLDNAHPFIGKKFILAQNGTSKEFFTDYWETYWKETDSETILMYLEEMCNTLEECITMLDEIDCPIWIIFLFHKGRTLIYSDSCRWSYINIEDTTELIDWEEKIIKSTLKSFTNLKDDSIYEYRNWFYMILDSISEVIDTEWNYDEEFNSETYWTPFSHWWEAHKKTQKTKKKQNGLVGYKKNNSVQTSILVNKKNYSKKKGTSMKKKKQSMNMQNLSENIMELTSSYVFDDFETPDEILVMINSYWITSSLNDKSAIILSELIFSFIKDNDEFQYVYWIADKDVFNYRKLDWPPVFIDYLFILPIKYLIRIEIMPNIFRALNLIRHMRLLNKIIWDQYVDYFIALEYFAENLDRDSLFPFTLETFLEYMYNIKAWDQEHCFITSWMNPSMASIIEWFILAWYVFWFQARDMNIEERLYDNLTSKF